MTTVMMRICELPSETLCNQEHAYSMHITLPQSLSRHRVIFCVIYNSSLIHYAVTLLSFSISKAVQNHSQRKMAVENHRVANTLAPELLSALSMRPPVFSRARGLQSSVVKTKDITPSFTSTKDGCCCRRTSTVHCQSLHISECLTPSLTDRSHTKVCQVPRLTT